MAVPKGNCFLISANLLKSGTCVWRRADGSWTTNLQEAHPAATEAERDAMLAAAAKEETVVADPFALPAHQDGNRIDPLTARERIRANGPTVAYRRPDRAA